MKKADAADSLFSLNQISRAYKTCFFLLFFIVSFSLGFLSLPSFLFRRDPGAPFFVSSPRLMRRTEFVYFLIQRPPFLRCFLFFYFGPSVSSLLFSMCWSVRRRVVGSCRPARYRYTVWDMEKPTSVTTGLNFSPLR